MAGFVAAAVVGSALVGAYTANKAGKTQAKAAEKASDTSLQSTRETNQLIKDQYEQGRADQEPWRLAGANALKEIQTTPDFQFGSDIYKEMADPSSDFNTDFKFEFNQDDPSYKFRQQEGINALDRSAASRGRVLSGAQDRAVTRYASDLASQEYGNQFNRALQERGTNLDAHNSNINKRMNASINQYNTEKGVYNTNIGRQQSLANVGQQTAGNMANAGQQAAGNIASNTRAGTTASNNALIGGANAQAAGLTGVGTAVNQGIGNVLLGYKNGAFGG